MDAKNPLLDSPSSGVCALFRRDVDVVDLFQAHFIAKLDGARESHAKLRHHASDTMLG